MNKILKKIILEYKINKVKINISNIKNSIKKTLCIIELPENKVLLYIQILLD